VQECRSAGEAALRFSLCGNLPSNFLDTGRISPVCCSSGRARNPSASLLLGPAARKELTELD